VNLRLLSSSPHSLYFITPTLALVVTAASHSSLTFTLSRNRWTFLRFQPHHLTFHLAPPPHPFLTYNFHKLNAMPCCVSPSSSLHISHESTFRNLCTTMSCHNSLPTHATRIYITLETSVFPHVTHQPSPPSSQGLLSLLALKRNLPFY